MEGWTWLSIDCVDFSVKLFRARDIRAQCVVLLEESFLTCLGGKVWIKKRPCALALLHTVHESLVVRMWPFWRHGCLYSSAQRTLCNTISLQAHVCTKSTAVDLSIREKHLRLHSVHFQWSYASVKPKSVKKGGYQLDFWHEFFAVLVFLRWLHVLHLSWFRS